jgi:hypothetical protein
MGTSVSQEAVALIVMGTSVSQEAVARIVMETSVSQEAVGLEWLWGHQSAKRP